MATSGCFKRECHLLFVTDISGRKYLVDSGSEVSLLPVGQKHLSELPQPKLRAANGSSIPVYEVGRLVSVDLGLSRVYSFKFIVAAVPTPIIGADFLREYGLMIDMQGRRLVDSATFLSTNSSRHVDHPDLTCISAVQRSNQDSDLFRDIRQSSALEKLAVPPSGFPVVTVPGVTHRIVTRGKPVFARPRRLMPAKLAAAKRELDELIARGILVPSSSPWSSPIHLVEKDGGTSFRMVGCYERLNAITVPDRYPVPHMQTFADQLAGAKIFSTIDLPRAFAQVPVHEDDQEKTAITTPFGLFHYTRMPFGLCNAAQTFQRLMDTVLRGMPRVYCYLDDILVFSPDAETHREDLQELFRRLLLAGLAVKPEKCVFGASSVRFVGLEVSACGIEPLPDKVAGLLAMQPPRNATQCRRYLGMVNHFHRFLPNLASTLEPLHAAAKLKREFVWGPQQAAAFESTKSALAAVSRLAYPLHDALTKVVADASDRAVGAVILQLQNHKWVPLAYHSRILTGSQLKWCTGDKELFALFSAVKRFRHLLEGRPNLQLWTDHKPLIHAFTSSSERSARVQRQLAYLSEFSTDVRHIKGRDNAVSDCLSRPPDDALRSVSEIHAEAQQGLDLKKLALAQQGASDIAALAASSSLRIERRDVEGVPTGLLVDVSTGVDRPLAPEALQYEIYLLFHSMHHPSARTTRRLISERFVFSRISSKVSAWVRNCTLCQRCKVGRHQHTSLRRPATPSGRFEALHVDVVGPLPEDSGHRYLFTIVDRYTRYPEAIPTPEASAASCARALLDWTSRFGMCLCITSDRGQQFVSDLWTEFWSILGVQLKTTCAYSPQQNGLVERIHLQLKSSLTAALESNVNWMAALHLVLMGIRAAYKPDINSSSAEMVFGEKMRLPGQFFSQTQLLPANETDRQLATSMSILRPTPTAWHRRYDADRPFVSQPLMTATHVFVRVDAVRPPLTPPYRGPYAVLQRGDKAFVLDFNGRPDTVAIDRLKPAFSERSQTCSTPLPPSAQTSQDAAEAAAVPTSVTESPVPADTSHTLRPPRIVWSRRARPIRAPVRFQ